MKKPSERIHEINNKKMSKFESSDEFLAMSNYDANRHSQGIFIASILDYLDEAQAPSTQEKESA